MATQQKELDIILKIKNLSSQGKKLGIIKWTASQVQAILTSNATITISVNSNGEKVIKRESINVDEIKTELDAIRIEKLAIEQEVQKQTEALVKVVNELKQKQRLIDIKVNLLKPTEYQKQIDALITQLNVFEENNKSKIEKAENDPKYKASDEYKKIEAELDSYNKKINKLLRSQYFALLRNKVQYGVKMLEHYDNISSIHANGKKMFLIPLAIKHKFPSNNATQQATDLIDNQHNEEIEKERLAKLEEIAAKNAAKQAEIDEANRIAQEKAAKQAEIDEANRIAQEKARKAELKKIRNEALQRARLEGKAAGTQARLNKEKTSLNTNETSSNKEDLEVIKMMTIQFNIIKDTLNSIKEIQDRQAKEIEELKAEKIQNIQR